jgi:HD-GYP domain-containing protein (c-di-GMP phosphodiesterase class II)
VSSESINIQDFLNLQRLKEFLTVIIQEGFVAVSIYDSHGHPILEEVSSEIPKKRIQEVRSKLGSKDLRNLLLSTQPLDAIHQDTALPVYGVPLSHNAIRIGAVTAWISEDMDPASRRRIFFLAWLHLQDLISTGYELNNLSSEIVRNYEELALLYNISSRLGTESDLNRIMAIVAEHVQSVLPASNVAILLVDKDKEEIVSKLALNGKGSPLPALRLKLGKGITGQVIATGQPKIVCNVQEHDAFVKAPYPITSLLSVPIAMGNNLIGAINVSDKAHGAEFTTYDQKLVLAIASEAAVALENARLFNEVKDLYFSAVKSLVMAIDAKDPYTHSHSVRVSELSSAIAEVMGFEKRMVEDIKLAALLHDVGKIGVPEHVLLKRDKLTDEEWEEMKQHPLHSVHILDQVKAFEHLSKWVRHEHERYDGKGYPDGLKGEEIPLASRIIAVADAFDAITSDRHYRAHRSDEVALKILQEHAGTQFDPQIVQASLVAFRKAELSKVDHFE